MYKKVPLDLKKIFISLGVIVVVALIAMFSRDWRINKTARVQPTNTANEVDLTEAKQQVVLNYQAERKRIFASLVSLLNKKLSAGDVKELSGLRDQLVDLPVPLELQSEHLSLVLKLSLLVDLLSPNRLRIASPGLPSVATVQQQLRGLVK